MKPVLERAALQLAIGAACIVPIAGGAYGIAGGFDGSAIPTVNDSHIRYLSGLLFALGLAFLWCSARVERRTASIRLLTFIVLTGGAARALTTPITGIAPETALALVMELGVAPFLCVWQARVSRLFR